MKPKLLITQSMPDVVEMAAFDAYDTHIRRDLPPLTEAEVTCALQDYDAILPTLGDRFTGAAINAAATPRCKILANFGVGYNHIDVAAARAKGVAVTNTPGAVTDATADIAMTLMLMTARRASEGEALLRAGNWTGWRPTQLLGMHLTGKRIGIVGMGRIGQAIARRAHFGFGMAVQYYNRSPKSNLDVPATYRDDLHRLLGSVDVVVIALAATPETRNLIDAPALAAMQNHAILINIARGDIVDEPALIAALQSGQIGGAGLDVYAGEPQIPPALIALKNTSLLPHLGTAALEVRASMGMMAIDNLAAFFDGRALPNGV